MRIELNVKSNKCYTAFNRANLQLEDVGSSGGVSGLLRDSPGAETVPICHCGLKAGPQR